jgi:PAS domain S-box-containing protein
MARITRAFFGYLSWTVAMLLFGLTLWNAHVQTWKLAEAASLKERMAEAIYDSSDYALAITDKAGKVLLFNPAAEALSGYSEQEMIGNDIYCLMPDDKIPLHKEKFTRRLGSKKFREEWGSTVQRLPCNLKHKDGHLIPMFVSIKLFVEKGLPTLVHAQLDPKASIKGP